MYPYSSEMLLLFMCHAMDKYRVIIYAHVTHTYLWCGLENFSIVINWEIFTESYYTCESAYIFWAFIAYYIICLFLYR